MIGALQSTSSIAIWNFGPGGSLLLGVELPCPQIPSFLTVDDADGDGDLDLLALSYKLQGSSSVFENLGGLSFAAAVDYAVGPYPVAARLIDLDQDGLKDLVSIDSAFVSDGFERLTLRRGQPGGGFAPALSFGLGRAPSALAIEDMDGDSLPDLVVANSLSRDIWLLPNLLLR